MLLNRRSGNKLFVLIAMAIVIGLSFAAFAAPAPPVTMTLLTWQAPPAAQTFVILKADKPAGPFLKVGETVYPAFAVSGGGSTIYVIHPVNNGKELSSITPTASPLTAPVTTQ